MVRHQPGDEPPAPRSGAIAEISLVFESFRAFVSQYGRFLSHEGLFLHTGELTPLPVDTELRLRFSLEDGFVLIQGRGRVLSVGKPTADGPDGMAIRFLDLDAASWELITNVVERTAEEGGAAFELTAAVPGAAPADPPSGQRPTPPPASSPDSTQVAAPLPPSSGDVDPTPPEPASGPAVSPVGAATVRQPIISDSPAVDDDGTLAVGASGGSGADGGLDTRARAGFGAELDALSTILEPDSELKEPEGVETPPPIPAPVPPFQPEESSVFAEDEVVERPRRNLPVSPLLIVLLVISGIVGGATYFFLERLVLWRFGIVEPLDRTVLDIPPEEMAPFPEPPHTAAVSTAPTPPPPPVEEASTPPPPPALPTAPASAESPEDGAAMADVEIPATKIRMITWKEDAAGTLLSLWADGNVPGEACTRVRLGGDRPGARELLKIQGINWPFRDPIVEVGSSQIDRLRTGFHPKTTGNELHVVLDLADPSAEILDLRADGTRVDVLVGSGPGS